MIRFLLLSVLLLCCCITQAARITGTVTDNHGSPLPFASITIKGTTKGVTANNEGHYSIELSPGEYTLVCQYVGYTRQEKKVTVDANPQVIDFHLTQLQLSMTDVIVRPGGEDPAYAIIRKAIKKRKEYEQPLDSFSCEAYIKTLMRSISMPKKVFGQVIEESDKKEIGVDSAGKGIIFLSESLTRVYYKRPDKVKLEVISGRTSGSNEYGFSVPTFINFYSNDVRVLGDQLNPRGFISPIAEGALNYYRYQFLGSYFEDGKEINHIKVIPKRKYEPLFSGTIDIMEDEWRIHSLDLLLVKESQLQILDTLEIRQIHAPIPETGNSGRNAVWQVKDQTVNFSFKLMGFAVAGNFINVYNNFDVVPVFRKRFFNRVLMKYDSSGNLHTKAYWDSVRPVPLEPDEKENYQVRDSVYQYNRDSMGTKANRDSLLRKQGPVKVLQVLSTGVNRSNFKQPRPLHYTLDPLLSGIRYNTVEGIDMKIDGTVSRALPGRGGLLLFAPHIRYGFHNTRLNPWASLVLNHRVGGAISGNSEDGSALAGHQSWILAGGKQVAQFNDQNPMLEAVNDLYTVFFRRNYLKIYERYFVNLGSVTRLDNGFRLKLQARYEDRLPLNNTSDYSLVKYKDRPFTPNYPIELLTAPFVRHQAALTSASVQYQPGQQYVEFPDHRVSLGSSYPTMELSYEKGWSGVLGSDVNFDKWRFSVWDDANFKLLGLLRYRVTAGGFFNSRSVPVQDYEHFNGDRTVIATNYANGFQLAPYYALSTTASFYTTAHLEHHFNGLLTNKIPLFRRLNWTLVGGGNVYYVNGSDHYEEVFGGLENILKFFRIDWVGSWRNGRYYQSGIRIGLGGLLGGGFAGAAARKAGQTMGESR